MEEQGRAERDVREVIARYVDAVYRADVETLRACFHPSAAMSGYLGDQLLTGGPEPFFADVAGRPSMEASGASYVAEVTALEVVGGAASLRLDETGFFGSFAFANWFHLVRVEGGSWLIVSKLFTMRPAGEA